MIYILSIAPSPLCSHIRPESAAPTKANSSASLVHKPPHLRDRRRYQVETEGQYTPSTGRTTGPGLQALRAPEPLLRPAAQRENQIQIGSKRDSAQIVVGVAAQQISKHPHCNTGLHLLVQRIQGQRAQYQQQIPPALPIQQRAKMISATSTAPTTPQNPNPPLLFISAPPFSYRAVKFRFSIVYYNIALIYVSIPDERPPFYLKCCQDETPLISLISIEAQSHP